MQVQTLNWEDPLDREMATCSSILAWKIPGRGAWWATVHGGHKESDVTEHTHTVSRLSDKCLTENSDCSHSRKHCD